MFFLPATVKGVTKGLWLDPCTAGKKCKGVVVGAKGLGRRYTSRLCHSPHELRMAPMVPFPQGFSHTDFGGFVVNPAILENSVTQENVFQIPNS